MSATKIRVLDEARGLVQTKGYNGFSLQDLADEVGIKKPSLYDHFPSKDDLGKTLIESYISEFEKWTETIAVFEPEAQIGALFEAFCTFSNDSRVCPLAAMNSDYNSLPKGLKSSLRRVNETRLLWLESLIEKGQKNKVFRRDKSANELAIAVMAMGVGAQLLARVNSDPELIRNIKTQALDVLTPKSKS